jgi:hypothetical protein
MGLLGKVWAATMVVKNKVQVLTETVKMALSCMAFSSEGG